MYYLYHIPGKKIGVTRNLNNRVTLIQGYKPSEYEVLDQSDDIDYISDKEIELQKSYGYKVDRKLYKNLFNIMRINVTEQTSTFACPLNQLQGYLEKNMGLEWKTSHGNFKLDAQTIQWILDNAKMSMYNDKRSYIYNKAFAEYFKATRDIKCEKKPLKLFEQIRDWARERGLYDKGDVNTQYVKLQEEAGELAKALLKDDQPEVIDAIGDMVVVLTNLAHQRGIHIETCIAEAYKVISKRKGKMINGTFVKDEE
jgi:NTP pyrophosphatase (non-canonical NTP hydrolase)